MIKTIDSKFTLNLPYPVISVIEENSRYGNILLQNYSGEISHFSLSSQFNYYELVSFKTSPVISAVLKGISKIDNYHMNILGKLIVLLGEDPRYWINRKKTSHYWNPKFLKYTNKIDEILKNCIYFKTNLISQYEKTLLEIDDDKIVAILKRILSDQEFHLKLLIELQEKYSEKI